MYLPPLQPIQNTEIYVNGDVTIHPNAALAPGTILQAAPNSRIIIHAGVCIGMGAILNVAQGSLEIEAGAVLGAGVLIIGNGKIGANACIGVATTIFNHSIETMAVIPAYSILGDPSRSLKLELDSDPEKITNPTPEKSFWDDPPEATTPPESSFAEKISEAEPELMTEPEPAVETVTNESQQSNSTNYPQAPVVGQVYINQLLLTLFPDNASFKNRQKRE
jgi:carbon dioxide concentrating mechanism protein CcmN